MGKYKIDWLTIIDKLWFACKIFFVILIASVSSYIYGSYNPNDSTIKRVNNELDLFYMKSIKEMGLQEPDFTYNNDMTFIRAMHKCINYINFTLPKEKRVPYEMIIGQAALESGWGTSRFANEANNLFGIRTFSKNVKHLLPEGMTNWPGWGVRAFASKCDSVKEYIRLLNEHPAYEEFRKLRFETNDATALIKTLDKFSTTPDYDKRVIRMINKIKKIEEGQ